MRAWVDGLGHYRQEILGRLSKDSVRNHQNIRVAGQGGAPAAAGGVAYNAAMDVRHDVSQYVHNAVSAIPGVPQAEHMYHKISQFSGPATGSRELSNSALNAGGASSFYRPPEGPPPTSPYAAPPIPPRPVYSEPPSSLYNNTDSGPPFNSALAGPPSVSAEHGQGQEHHHHHRHHPHPHHNHEQEFRPGYAPAYSSPPAAFPSASYPSSSPGYSDPIRPGGFEQPYENGPQFPQPQIPGEAPWYPPPGGPPPSSGYYNNPPGSSRSGW